MKRIHQAGTRPEPISLSDQELGKPDSPVRVLEEPIPVDAWVRFPETPVLAEARAVAHTPKAVLVEFDLGDGHTHRCWVWASAVTRTAPSSDTPSGS